VLDHYLDESALPELIENLAHPDALSISKKIGVERSTPIFTPSAIVPSSGRENHQYDTFPVSPICTDDTGQPARRPLPLGRPQSR